MPRTKAARDSAASLSEPECRRALRALGITSATEWTQWCRRNATRRRRLHLPLYPEREYRNRGFWAEYGSRYPKGWTDFHRTRDRHLGTNGVDQLALWARYAARYRAASGYCDIRFAGLSNDVGRGYSAAFGVVLAYSALEACWNALGPAKPKAHETSIIAPALASRLRRALRSGFRLWQALNAPLSKRVSQFMDGDDGRDWPESQDVLTVARAVRHLFAHGVFTPSGGGALTVSAARALQDLSDVVLQLSETTFRRSVNATTTTPSRRESHG